DDKKTKYLNSWRERVQQERSSLDSIIVAAFEEGLASYVTGDSAAFNLEKRRIFNEYDLRMAVIEPRMQLLAFKMFGEGPSHVDDTRAYIMDLNIQFEEISSQTRENQEKLFDDIKQLIRHSIRAGVQDARTEDELERRNRLPTGRLILYESALEACMETLTGDGLIRQYASLNSDFSERLRRLVTDVRNEIGEFRNAISPTTSGVRPGSDRGSERSASAALQRLNQNRGSMDSDESMICFADLVNAADTRPGTS
ncbi:hypothetical protein QAD02_006580, partial [Eretmocerus hayati]